MALRDTHVRIDAQRHAASRGVTQRHTKFATLRRQHCKAFLLRREYTSTACEVGVAAAGQPGWVVVTSISVAGRAFGNAWRFCIRGP